LLRWIANSMEKTCGVALTTLVVVAAFAIIQIVFGHMSPSEAVPTAKQATDLLFLDKWSIILPAGLLVVWMVVSVFVCVLRRIGPWLLYRGW